MPRGWALPLLARVGRGGSGSVWRAHDELPNRDVAIKRLHGRSALAPLHSQVLRVRSGVGPTDEKNPAGWAPEPRSGTGPLPIPQPKDSGRGSDLAQAAVVPPPPPGDRSLEDELTRRAQRRRRPLGTSKALDGRHALAPPQKDAPTLHEGGDTLSVVAEVLTFSEMT
jgi:hypothetical protein